MAFLDIPTPWQLPVALFLFIASSALMICALAQMEQKGMEGTVLGTVVIPYCSGLSNLIFAVTMGKSGAENGYLVMENCLVNNVTNLTLLIGLPTLIWGMNLIPPLKTARKKKTHRKLVEQHRLDRLSILLTLFAVLFFTAALWTLAGDGELTRRDGCILIGLFAFWQVFQVFDMLKYNVVQKKSRSSLFVLDIALVLLSGYLMFDSIDWLVSYIIDMGNGFLGKGGLGWLSGWLMVLPNAFLAIYYAAKKRSDIAYSSQIGDGHICIPLCMGVFCLFSEETTIPLESFNKFIAIIAGTAALQTIFVSTSGRLPKWLGAALILCYIWLMSNLIYSSFGQLNEGPTHPQRHFVWIYPFDEGRNDGSVAKFS